MSLLRFLVRAGRAEVLPDSASIWDAYMSWFYDQSVWKSMHWHGIRTLKLPSDMWNYQEIIWERNIDFVIETGTRHGGSALFFADALSARGASGKVVTIDISNADLQIRPDPRIHLLEGDSACAEIVEEVRRLVPASSRKFMILDSDHTYDHVLHELEVWVPFLSSGDYLVVEDTNINGHPVRRDFGPGPWEAVESYCERHPSLLIRDQERERKFGATAAPNGYFIKR